MRRLLLTSCMSAALLCLSVQHHGAMAADSVAVRTGTHDGYSRLVFEWQKPVPYTAVRSGTDNVDIEFQSPAAMDSSGVNIKTANTILGFEKLSTDGQNLKVRIKIPEGSSFHNFLVGNKVVLDIYKSVIPAPETDKKPAVAPAPITPVAVEATPPSTPLPKPDQPVQVGSVAAQSAPALTPIQKAAQPVMQPHAIAISSTTAMGMAAFTRNDDLWIVLDRNDITVPPQIGGAQKDKFPPFEKIDIDGGVAYRMRIPQGLNVYGEGGGLVWKLIMTPLDHPVKAIDPERSFTPGDNIRGGTLFWPMQRVTKVLTFKDPDIGDTVVVGTVDKSNQFAGTARDYVDFFALNTPVGIAILPKADDVEMIPSGNGVQISRPSGLALSRIRDINQRSIEQQIRPEVNDTPGKGVDASGQMKRMFDFDRWMMGGITALRENQQIVLSNAAAKDTTGRVQDLLMLAKMNIANDRGQEAVGFLNFTADEMKEIADTPEYLALRGAAEAMAGKFEVALEDLNTPVLKDYDELNYWRAYTLSCLEDWQQAKEVMPKNFDALLTYPRKIQERLSLKLAELALRSGDAATAEKLLGALEKDRKFLQSSTLAGLDYLSGEKHRQANETQQALDLWKPLTAGKDDLYRAKANLAMTMLQLQNKQIAKEEAIDHLEGLRYHWRGDELEAQVNYILGKLYLDDGRYMKAFTILRDATAMSPETDISREIASYMADSFKSLFLGPRVNEMSPVDAVTVYEEFRELTPAGDEGNRLVQRLAERLVDADLLDRAAKLLGHQVDYRLAGREKADVALRLAAIDLLNKDSKSAIAAIGKAEAAFAALTPQTPEIVAKLKESELLRARAYSDMDRVEDGLAILKKFPPAPDVNALRADIAWSAGMWQDSAEAIQDLILDEAIDLTRPLTQKQADLILNRAVALNLAGDRVALSTMRTKYGEAMTKTARSKMFDVVTRQRTGTMSSDRESIAALVSEVDLFKGFLDSYRATATPSN